MPDTVLNHCADILNGFTPRSVASGGRKDWGCLPYTAMTLKTCALVSTVQTIIVLYHGDGEAQIFTYISTYSSLVLISQTVPVIIWWNHSHILAGLCAWEFSQGCLQLHASRLALKDESLLSLRIEKLQLFRVFEWLAHLQAKLIIVTLHLLWDPSLMLQYVCDPPSPGSFQI